MNLEGAIEQLDPDDENDARHLQHSTWLNMLQLHMDELQSQLYTVSSAPMHTLIGIRYSSH